MTIDKHERAIIGYLRVNVDRDTNTQQTTLTPEQMTDLRMGTARRAAQRVTRVSPLARNY